MSMRVLSRRVAALVLAGIASGCSSTGPAVWNQNRAADECRSNRGGCLYNGKYDDGEKEYAEEEARRLNVAEQERFRRAFGK